MYILGGTYTYTRRNPRNLHTKEYQCGNKDDIKSIHYIIIIIINQLIHSLLVKTSMGPRFYSIINFHLKCSLDKISPIFNPFSTKTKIVFKQNEIHDTAWVCYFCTI